MSGRFGPKLRQICLDSTALGQLRPTFARRRVFLAIVVGPVRHAVVWATRGGGAMAPKFGKGFRKGAERFYICLGALGFACIFQDRGAPTSLVLGNVRPAPGRPQILWFLEKGTGGGNERLENCLCTPQWPLDRQSGTT